jgi:hypothetical protein|uniref:Uncharacterized protein n=1 Tax=Fagus sylvatica TaxID=28930 RepID=A0A2N9HMS6_FAGSY
MVRQATEETEMAEEEEVEVVQEQESVAPKKEAKEELPHDIESQVKAAMHSRVAHFKEQAEYFLSLSFSYSLTCALIHCCAFWIWNVLAVTLAKRRSFSFVIA